MTSSLNLLVVKEADIERQRAFAQTLIDGYAYAPRSTPAPTPGASVQADPLMRRRRSTVAGASPLGAQPQRTVHLAETLRALAGNDPLPSLVHTRVLRGVRRAIAVAGAVVDLYGSLTPLNTLKESNKLGRLTDSQRGEFAELLNAASLIALFSAANHLAHALTDCLPDTDSIQLAVADPTEVVLDNPVLAVQGFVYELDAAIRSCARDEPTLVRTIKLHLEKLVAELLIDRAGVKHLAAFEGSAYRVEADAFTLTGFEPVRRASTAPLVMSFKTPQEVVGNHIAKYQAMKLAKMLMAYDFKRQLNPFVGLGGFQWTVLGDGNPGTGKTTLIQMMAGLLNDYCRNAGYPFRYANFSTDQISSYQGQSGQNAKAFVNSVMDPNVIGFGTVDDIDQICGKRGDRQASAGQLEVTAVLMESFAGPNTIVRGNVTFGMFSNYPELVDDALRQRAGGRWLIDGPKTAEDYIDLLALLIGKRTDIPVGDVELYITQNIQKVIDRSYEQYSVPQESRLREIYDTTVRQHGRLDTLEKLGRYLKAIQAAEPRFTGRAVKNIMDAVKVRALDVELPDEWVEDPPVFLERDYDTKLAMVSGLMKPITADMVIQEINSYAGAEFRYSGKSDEAEIDRMVRDLRLQTEARKRFAAN